MNIDWSKAPEGATHHCSARNAWFKQDENDMWLAWQAYGRMLGQPLIGWCFCHAPDGSSVTARAWTGEGLPPVGIEIEAMMRRNMHDGYAWHRAKVVHGPLPGSEGEVLVFCLETTSPAWVDEFRTVRTPEQIEMETRKAAVEAMAEELKSLSGPKCLGVLYGIYDLGYRKQVEP